LGDKIARFRRAMGLSQDELAAQLGVTRTIVSAWENDRRRPRRDKLAALDAALGTVDEFVSWPLDHESDDLLPVLEAPITIGALLRDVADALVERLRVVEAVDGQPRYGWSQHLEEADRPPSAMGTAYGLKTMLLVGTKDWRIDLTRVREQLRRLELPDGGWSALPRSPLARPEVTSLVVGALRDAGEADDYISERVRMIVELLEQRAARQYYERPYVLATSLLVLSRLRVDEAAARRFIDDLVDMSTYEDGARSWPVVVKPVTVPPPGQSTPHTAIAVCALAAWARRLGDASLVQAVASGRLWLERHVEFDLRSETILSPTADGGEEVLPVDHFTPAWVLRAILDAGGDPDARISARALRATLSFYSPEVALWRWPHDGGSLPVWMTHHGVAGLTAWAMARKVD
jgi:transcriptional regulator with XRE-family HTH domain